LAKKPKTSRKRNARLESSNANNATITNLVANMLPKLSKLPQQQRSGFEEMISQIMAGQIPPELAGTAELSAPLFTSPSRKLAAKGRKRLAKWEDWAATSRFALDKEFSVQDINFGVEFEIESMHQDGLVVGHYCVEDERLRFFANLNPEAEDPRLGCECLASLGTKPCIHTFTFLDWFNEVVDNSDFELYEAITRSQFQSEKPDLSSLSKLDTAKVSALLNQKAPLPATTSSALSDVSALEQVEVATAQRLCWDLKDIDSQARFQLRIQQPKKRGVGWTKGKRVSSSNLLAAVELANETDRKIISRIPDDSLYYSRSIELPVTTTCFDLLGRDNVTIEGKPAVIKRFQPAVEYYEEEAHCGVRLQLPTKKYRLFVFNNNCLIAVLPECSEILIANSSEEGATALQRPSLNSRVAAVRIAAACRAPSGVPDRFVDRAAASERCNPTRDDNARDSAAIARRRRSRLWTAAAR